MSLRKQDLVLFVGGAFIIAVLYALIQMRIIGAFWQLNLLFFGLNIIFTASLNLINGYTGQFSLGHAGFSAVGAYTAAVLTVNFHAPFLVSLLAGTAAAALLGVLIGLPTLRLRGDYLAIATLGLGEIVRVVIINIDYVGGAAGFSGIPKEANFLYIYGFALLTLFFLKNYIHSSYGRASIAIREDEIAAEAMGIPTTKYKVMAFAIGAGFAGLGGGLLGHTLTYLNPTSFTFMQSFFYLIMVVLGGMGSLTGSIIGAFFVTILQAALSDWPEYRMIVFSILLIVFMIYRPRGIAGYVELTDLPILRRYFKKEVK